MNKDIIEFCESIGIHPTEEQIKEYETRKLASDLFDTTELLGKMYRGEADKLQHITIGGESFTIYKGYMVLEEEIEDES